MARSSGRGLARWVARIFRSNRPTARWHAIGPKARLRLESLESRVVPIATVTTVLSSPDPSLVGQSVTFTADVKTTGGALVGEGSVEFQIGNSSYGPETVSNGVAAFEDSSLPEGAYSVSAAYTGNDKYGNSSGELSGGQNVDEAPGFTSVNTTTLVIGSYGSFTIAASGFPSPSLSESGPLPAGVTFNAATGLLSGTPAASDPNGAYSLTFTASNNVGSPAEQAFTLVLDQAPAITSSNTTTFAAGSSNEFTVTASGYPAPSLGYSGTLPGGVYYDTDTGELYGTPDTTDESGEYTVTFTANNGVGSPATQTFYLLLNQPPAFTSSNNTTFVDGSSNSFTVTASGTPTPTLSYSGSLPAGVTFNAATGLLSGTPDPSDPGGVYSLTFTAENGFGSPATQSFFLVLAQAPVFTSVNTTTFTDGSSGSFTVTASGSPPPQLGESGTLPAGITFDSETGVLSGTPDGTDPGGVYSLTFTANNGVGSPATQTFALDLDQLPAFTSANGTNFVASSYGSFAVAAIGSPTPILSESGPLPVGVTFDADTGILSGTPAFNADGFYPLTFTADNGLGSPATQSFRLWVLPPATPTTTILTSSPNPTDYGQAATFTATVTPASGTFDDGGTVTLEFDDDPTTDVTEGLSDGIATFTVSNLAPGSHTATATYSGDTAFATSTGNLSTDQVVIPTTTTTLTANPDPLVLLTSQTNNGVGEYSVTLTATVTNVGDPGNTPTGTVDFFDSTDGVDLGTGTLDENGQAAIGVPYLDPGTFSYTATFTPLGDFIGSAGTLTEPVQIVTDTIVAASPSVGVLGQPVTLSATVSNGDSQYPGPPTGNVDFVDESSSPATDLGTAPVQNGVASLTATFSSAGPQDIVAVFTPTGIFAESQDQSTVPVDPADYWNNPAGGNWDDPQNWSDGVPTAADDVYFGSLNPSAVINIGLLDQANNITSTSPLSLSGVLVSGSGSDSINIGGDAVFNGPLTITGVGVPLGINIAGNLNVSGPVVLNGGSGSDSITIGGDYVLGDTTIQAGCTLSGVGKILGNLTLNGNLDMGNSIGAVSVAGNYMEGSTGMLTIKAGGPMANDIDQLSVMGAVMLNGTLNVDLINDFMPAAGQPLPYLDVTQPVMGKFNNFEFPLTDGIPDLQPIILVGGLGFELAGQAVSVSDPGVPTWIPEGPQGIQEADRIAATPDNLSAGAISSVVVDPDNGMVYAGTVGGGVWEANQDALNSYIDTYEQVGQTGNPGFEQDLWTPLTNNQASLAVSTMALDPTDPSGNTLWVGTGSVSSSTSSTILTSENLGGPAAGLLETTNGGTSWTDVGSGIFNTPIYSIVARGQSILVGTNGQGLWESTNGGASFEQAQIDSLDGVSLPSVVSSVVVSSIVADETVTGRYYASITAIANVSFSGNVTDGSASITGVAAAEFPFVPAVGETVSGPGIPTGTTIVAIEGTTIALSAKATSSSAGASLTGPRISVSGVYESVNDGASWSEIDEQIPQIVNAQYLVLTDSVLDDGNTCLFVVTGEPTTIPNPDSGALLTGVFRTEIPADFLTGGEPNWVDCPGPLVNEFAGYGHFYAVSDPADPNAIYVGGYQQCLFHVFTDVSSSGQGEGDWAALSLGSVGEPHDDQRSVAFLGDTLLATGDGGIFALPDVSNEPADDYWESLNENINDGEFFQVAYDSIDGLIVGGLQDNGTALQDFTNQDFTWSDLRMPYVSVLGVNIGNNQVGDGDGGAVAVDDSGKQPIIYLTADGELRWIDPDGGPPDTGSLNTSGLNANDQQSYKKTDGQDVSYMIASMEDGQPGILLGLTSVYLVDKDNATDLQPAFMSGSVTALTGENAAGAAYFGTSTGQLFMSPGLNGAVPDPFELIPSFLPLDGSGVFARQIVADPNDPNTIYVLTNNDQVWGNLDVNVDPWQNLTGDLISPTGQSLVSNLMSLQLVRPNRLQETVVLLVGGLGGVYQTAVSLDGVTGAPAQTWTLFGTGLPNVQISSLEYVSSANLLVAGTYGYGAWEIPDVSSYAGTADQATLAASGGTLLIETDPSQPNNAEILTDAAGASIQQVLANDNVVLDEPWAGLSRLTVNASSETVDVLDLPASIQLTVDGSGSGPNTVNIGSESDKLSTIAGGLMVGTGSVGPGQATYVNVDDQGVSTSGEWRVFDGTIIEPNTFPGSISYAGSVADVTINGGKNTNAFTVFDTGGTNLNLNTGPALGNTVTVNNTSASTALTIDNQGTAAATTIEATGAGSQTDVENEGSFSSTTVDATGPDSKTSIDDRAGNSTTIILATGVGSKTDIEDTAGIVSIGNPTDGAQDIQGDINLSCREPDGDSLAVSDQADSRAHRGNYAAQISSSGISGLMGGTITYAPRSLHSLLLIGDSAGTTWDVSGTPIPYFYFEAVGNKNSGEYLEVQDSTNTIIECSSQDAVNIGDPGAGLQDVYGTVSVYAPAVSAALSLVVNDQSSTYLSPQQVTLTNDSLSGLDLGYTTIDYGMGNPLYGPPSAGGISELTVEAGTGGTAFEVGDPVNGTSGAPGTIDLSAEGSGNSVAAIGPDSMNLTWAFEGTSSGQTDRFTQGEGSPVINFSNIQALTGGPGENVFDFIETGFNGSIDGGPGGDSGLDFSPLGSASLSVGLSGDGADNGVQGTASDGTSFTLTFDDIDAIKGNAAQHDWQIGSTTSVPTYQGDFGNSLTVEGFANMTLDISGNLSGELDAATEGTAVSPLWEIQVEGDITSTGILKVGFLTSLEIGGEIDGIIKGFGNAPLTPSIQDITALGVGGTGQILAYVLSTCTIEQDFGGILSEMSPTADFDNLEIGGSFLSTGLIYAAAAGSLSVGGDFSGEAVIENALDSLDVGGTLDGTMSAGSYGSQQVDGSVTGQIDTGLATAPPVTIGTADAGGLTQAIYLANFIGIPNIINLAAGSTYALTMPAADTDNMSAFPSIATDITINGNGATLQAEGTTPFRLVNVSPTGSLTLTDLGITGGNSTNGGAVYNDGLLVLNNVALYDNTATIAGGAIYTAGSLTQSGTSFSGNTAPLGPNIYYAPGTTGTTLVDDGPSPSVAGEVVTLIVGVAGGVSDGEQVTIEDESANDAVVGTGTLADGSATIQVSDLTAGSHNLIAVYSGDSNLAGSQSGPVAQEVEQSPAFTSEQGTDFSVGDSNSFTVAASGDPEPALSENPSDVLPSGVSFDPDTGILSGTPAVGTEGVYILNFSADNGVGSDASQSFVLTVDPAQPVITWPTPAAIGYGTPLPTADLDATANVPGTFVYGQAPGDILPAADTPDLSVTFTPDDPADYATVTATVAIEVDPAPLTVYADSQWMTYGSEVPALTFSADGFVNGDTIASLPGSLATTATSSSEVGIYPITLGTLGVVDPNAAGNTSNYAITYIGANLTIDQATPVVNWSPPAPIDDQTPLGNTQLDATANVAGTFVYSPPAGTVLSVGSQTLGVTFYPADTLDYAIQTASVEQTVLAAAAPVITTQPTSQTVIAGATVTFEAAATGGPAPAVQWWVSDDGGEVFFPVLANAVYSGPTTDDLTITGVTSFMSGMQFEATFTNASGTVTTSAATLTVTSIGTTTAMVDYAPIVLNTEPIELTVTVNGGGPGGEVVNIEDETNGDAIVPTTGNTLTSGAAMLNIPAGALGGGSHVLIAVYGGDGKYAPSQSTPLTEVVDVPAAIVEQPEAETVGVGETATFTAAGIGYPAPTIQWMESTDRGNTWSTVPNATEPTLTLTDVAADENGDEFEAIFSNSTGAATTTPASLTLIPQPEVESISPSTGPEAGGTTVTITGTGLAGATAVDFGPAAATIVSDTGTQIVVSSPPSAAGVEDISVTTAGGTSSPSAGDVFTYGAGALPTVTSVGPQTGLAAGGTTVTISGENFAADSSVMFGDTPAESVTVLSSTSISAVAPAQGSMGGTVDITVTASAGTSATSAADRFGYASTSTSNVQTSSSSVEAGASITVTLHAEDASKDPLTAGGLTVLFSLANLSSSQGDFGSVTDNGDGTYTATFTGTIAGSYTIDATIDGQAVASGAPEVTVTPGPIDPAVSTIIPLASTVASGSSTTVELLTEDEFGNVVTADNAEVSFGLGSAGGGQGTFSSVNDNGDGSYSAAFTGTTAGDNAITASIGGQPVSSGSPAITITPGPASPAKSTVSIAAPELLSGSTTTVTLRAIDADDNELTNGGAAVTFSLSNPAGGTFGSVTDEGNGFYTATFTSVSAGVYSIQAEIGGQPVTSTPTVTVTTGQVDPTQSLVLVSDNNVQAGGTITVTLQAEDANGNDLTTGGSIVVFALGAGSGTGALSPVTDNGNGTYTATFVGQKAGTESLTATINGQPVTSRMPAITVTPASASLADSFVSVSAGSFQAGSPVAITLRAVDAYGNDLTTGGLAVAFSLAGPGGGNGVFGSVSDNGNGTYTAIFTGSSVGSNAIVAGIDGDLITTAPVAIDVTPGMVSAANSKLTLSTSRVQPGGAIDITLTALDAYGNADPTGITSAILALGGGAAIGNLSSVAELSTGVYTATFTGTADGSTSLLAVLNGSTIGSGSPPMITVTGNAVAPVKSKLKATLTTVAAGGTTMITFQAADSKSKAETAGGLAVTFKLNSTKGAQGTFGPVVDIGNGTYSVEFTGAIAGSNSITATVAGVKGSPSAIPIEVVPGAYSLSRSTVTASATTVTAGSKVKLSLQAEDAYGNIIGKGLKVTFSVAGMMLTGVYQTNGTYSVTFTPTAAGQFAIASSIDGQALTRAPLSIAVTPGAASIRTSLITLSEETVAVGGAITILFQAEDAFGNDESTGGLKVSFRLTGKSGGKGTFSAVTDNRDGTYEVIFNAIAVGSNTIEAFIDGTKVVDSGKITVL